MTNPWKLRLWGLTRPQRFPSLTRISRCFLTLERLEGQQGERKLPPLQPGPVPESRTARHFLNTHSRVSPTCRSLSSGKAPLSCLLCSVVSRDPISEPCLDQTVGKLPLRRRIWEVKVKSLSHVRLFATPWTVAYQVPLSVGFSRQDYWSGVPLPSLQGFPVLHQFLELAQTHDH